MEIKIPPEAGNSRLKSEVEWLRSIVEHLIKSEPSARTFNMARSNTGGQRAFFVVFSAKFESYDYENDEVEGEIVVAKNEEAAIYDIVTRHKNAKPLFTVDLEVELLKLRVEGKLV